MTTVVNFIDVTLRGAAARTVNLASAQILLTPSAPAFHVDAAGVITPESITFTATRIDIDAPLAFNSTGGPLAIVTATTATLAGADMVGSSATVIASATVNGQTYTGPCTISKFSDGKDATGADLTPAALKDILEGQLTTDELDAGLRTRISLIDAGAGTPGSVAAQVKAETDARIAAISGVADDNRTYVQQYSYSKTEYNQSLSAFGTSIQAAYQGYADSAAGSALAAAKAYAQSYAYSKADADSALTATANTLRSEFATLNQGTGATVAWVQEYAYSKAQADAAIASSTQQLSTTVGQHTATLELQGTSISGLGAQYAVKIDNNGYVAGYGLASTPINGVPTSSFIVLADRFAIGLPGQVTKYPFVVGLVNGVQIIGLRGDVILDGTLNIRTAAGYTGDMDATVGATWGSNVTGQPDDLSNLVVKSNFDDGTMGGWNGIGVEGPFRPGCPYSKTITTHARDAVEVGNIFPVTPGERIYMSGWIDTGDSVFLGRFGLFGRDASGNIIAFPVGFSQAAATGWNYYDGSVVMGAGVVSAQPWLGMEGFDFSGAAGPAYLHAAGLWIGRHARGATVGAPAGSMVGGTEAGLVASRAAYGEMAYNALPGLGQQIDARLRKDAADTISGQIGLQSQYALLVGDATNGVWMGSGGIFMVQGGVVKASMPISGNPTFAGQLLAAFGSFGAVSIAAGGSLALQASSYNNDPGIWFGFVAGTPKFSIVASNGAKLLYDPGLSNPLQVNGASVSGLSISDRPSIGPISDYFTGVGATGSTVTLAVVTPSVSGGKAPYSRSWSTQYVEQSGLSIVMTQNTDGTTATFKSSTRTAGVSCTMKVTFTITDSTGLAASSSFSIYCDAA